MRRRLIVGALVTVLLIAGVLAGLRGRGVSAVDHGAWSLEAPVARAAWRWLVPADTRTAANPVPASSSVLLEAREHWADHCATCHDNDGSGATTIGRRMYPPVPDIRSREVQSLTDGELFYAIEQGIPWTAMPGWTTSRPEGAAESWALVRFVRHLPDITPDEIKAMEALNPKAPTNAAREKEIEDFLRGPGTKDRWRLLELSAARTSAPDVMGRSRSRSGRSRRRSDCGRRPVLTARA